MEGGECNFFQTLREGSIFFFLSGLGMRVIPPNLKGKECNLSLIFFFLWLNMLAWFGFLKKVSNCPRSEMLKTDLYFEQYS